MLNDITNQKVKEFNNRFNNKFNELDKKMEINLFALKKLNSVFKQIKCSYDGTKAEQFLEKNRETFAGNPIKLIKNNRYR